MCVGGNINFPDPNEVGAAQFAWNNLNQTTPFGGVNYSAPEFDENGNITSGGSMEQWQTPEYQAMQEQMLGMRTGAMDQLTALMGGLGNYNFSGGGGPPAGGGGGYYGGDGGYTGGGGSDVGEYYDNKSGRMPIQGARGGTSGRATPGGLLGFRSGAYENPNQPGAVADTQDHRYGGSNVMGGTDDLNSLFYSNNAPALQYAFNRGSLPELLGAEDLLGERANTEQALYDRQMRLRQPGFDREVDRFKSEMANRGVPEGSELYNEGLDRIARQQGEQLDSIGDLARVGGLQEMQGLFGLSSQARGQMFGEQGAQMDMSSRARQQAFGETMGVRDSLLRSMLGMGQFGLQQQGQQYNQLAGILGMSQVPGAGGDLSQFYGPSPVDMMGAYGMNQQGQMHNAGNQITGAGLMSGLFGLGGSAMGAGAFSSDARLKTDFEDVDYDEILAKVGDLNIEKWSYIGDTGRRIGPMAQDFAEAFGTPDGGAIKTIDVVSALGVAMAAIKALSAKVEALENRS